MKIVYPTDGSKTAGEALTFAIEAAKAYRAEVVVVSVVQQMDAPHETIAGLEKVLLDFARECSTKAVDVIRKHHVKVEERVEIGDPPEVIDRIAREEKACCIVMGTHGRTGLARALIGSVADRVIRRSPCPVTLVPSRES
jgi:nucleotide-binding universal stress UspA family protein